MKKRDEWSWVAIPCPSCLSEPRWTFENFKVRDATTKTAKGEAIQFSKGRVPWLLLIGGHGSGKTHLARAARYALIKREQPVVYTFSVNLIDNLRRAISSQIQADVEEIMRHYETAEYLVIDDLGAVEETGWARERFERLFNYRYEVRLPTMATTNLMLSELPSSIASRFGDQRICRVVCLEVDDYRIRTFHGSVSRPEG